MRAVADLLAANPLVLLAILVAVGSAIGAITLKRFALGPAAVLFLALAVSAYDERLKLPAVVGQFGLVLFAYAIGVSAGPSFFSALRTGGRVLTAVVVLLLGGAAVASASATCSVCPALGALRRLRRVAHQHPGARREPGAAEVRAADRRLLRHLPRRARHDARRVPRVADHRAAGLPGEHRAAAQARAGDRAHRGRRPALDRRAHRALRRPCEVLPPHGRRRARDTRATSTWPMGDYAPRRGDILTVVGEGHRAPGDRRARAQVIRAPGGRPVGARLPPHRGVEQGGRRTPPRRPRPARAVRRHRHPGAPRRHRPARHGRPRARSRRPDAHRRPARAHRRHRRPARRLRARGHRHQPGGSLPHRDRPARGAHHRAAARRRRHLARDRRRSAPGRPRGRSGCTAPDRSCGPCRTPSLRR